MNKKETKKKEGEEKPSKEAKKSDAPSSDAFAGKSFSQIVEEKKKESEKTVEQVGKLGSVKKGLLALFKKKPEKEKKTDKQKQEDFVRKIKSDIFKEIKERKKKRAPAKRKRLRFYLTKAGFEDVDDIRLRQQIRKISVIGAIVIMLATFIIELFLGAHILRLILFSILLLVASFAVLLIFIWIGVYAFLDFRAYQRKVELEAVLADFLQLTSSNISAGMPIDRALWYAVRPKFGVLAKEIEEVAKATLTGEDLSKALLNFADKYDSVVLKRSINLLLEGMQGGGEIAELLNKIATDIQEIRIMKKEMAASVLTYVIFISFSTALIAPLLFSLSTELLVVMNSIIGNIDVDKSANTFIQIGGQSVAPADFQLFAVIMLIITSTMSAFIISTIRTGSMRKGVKMIFAFIICTLLFYWLGIKLFGIMMNGLL
jgi:Flp pilus assembly protein TadB